MLTRLQVDGFKNLRQVDLWFGPFTCIAGANGVGKSNLFDAIGFLAALAEKPLMEAALSVRGCDGRFADVRNLFYRSGDRVVDRIRMAAEMLIPEHGQDALGQAAHASTTFLRYEIELAYREDAAIRSGGTLVILSENMSHITQKNAAKHLPFPHSVAFRQSVVRGRRSSPLVSTDAAGIVSLHADSPAGKGGGRPNRIPASTMPRTMLSTVNNAAEHRTLVLARREIASWMQLALEPSALRRPDDLASPRHVDANGAHLPATLFRLGQEEDRVRIGFAQDLYQRIANRLSDLVEDVRAIDVEVDERRQSLTIVLTDHRGTQHAASALSDGTLRFLALTVMEADPHSRGLVCLEEPENGMHPLRVPAVIDLLGELAVDADEAVDESNPLRQVIVNTHSPTVVGCVHDAALVIAREVRSGDETFVSFHALPNTWRVESALTPAPPIAKGEMVRYLNPLRSELNLAEPRPHVGAPRRVADRSDLQLPLEFPESAE